MAFGGNTRDLGSFGEETDKITNLHQESSSIVFTEHGDDVAGIKRRRHDLSSDDVRNLATASGRGRLKEDLESSTLRWRQDFKATPSRIGVSTESDDTMNEDTSVGVASPVKEGVTPSVVDMMVEKEKICPLEDTIVLEFFPTLTMLVTTMAGNAPALTGLTLSFSSMDGLDAMHEKWTLGRAIIHVMSVLSMSGNLLGVRLVKVFGHIHEECPKNTGAGEKKTVKKPSHILSVSVGENESEDEIASVYNDMARSMANEKVGFGTQSLLEQRKDSYGNGDYDDDPIAKRYVQKVVYTPSFVIFDNLSPPVSLKMSEEDQNAGAVPPVKSDMHSYSSTMTAKDVKALAFKHNIPLDLHPVALTAEWTMDKLTDDFIDISDPAPKDGFDEADVVTLTHQPIDIRGIPSGLLFSAGLAVTWEFPKFYPLFKDPEGNVITMSEYLRLPFLSGMTIEAGRALTEQDVIPQHTTLPLNSDQPIPGKTDSQQRVETSDPKIVANRIRKAQAAAKRKTDKNRGSEGASGPERGSKRRKEKATDHIPCPTPLQTIEGVTSDASRGENVVSPTQAQGDNLLEIPPHDSANTTTHPCEEHHDEHSGVVGTGDGNFDDDVDEEVNLEGPERHINDTTERVVLGAESIPPTATRPDNGKSIAQEETPMPDPLLRGVGADGAGSSLPPSLFVPTWGIHQRSRVTTPEECRDLMANLTPPGVQEEMHLLDNNIVLDRAWFTLARGAMAQAHALRQFESLYDTHHALKEDLETTRSHLVRTREDFDIVQNFYNTLSERHRKLREEHAQCSEHLAVVQAEKDGLMATNAEQDLRIKELEQQLKSADEAHSSVVRNLEDQIAQKDSALVYAERVSSDRLSENEALRTQLAFAKREKTDAIKKLLPTVVARSEGELREIMMRMNGFDAYSDKKMNAEYERLFSKTYSYVDRISHLSEKSVQDLLKLHPAPPPKDAPKAGSGGIAFAPKLVRAAEVAGSKDTASREISKSKTGPSLQNPDRASGGSKALPSGKT
ncbi:hypothetical protein Tco_1142850 [Tanacetum coccineum]